MRSISVESSFKNFCWNIRGSFQSVIFVSKTQHRTAQNPKFSTKLIISDENYVNKIQNLGFNLTKEFSVCKVRDCVVYFSAYFIKLKTTNSRTLQILSGCFRILCWKLRRAWIKNHKTFIPVNSYNFRHRKMVEQRLFNVLESKENFFRWFGVILSICRI